MLPGNLLHTMISTAVSAALAYYNANTNLFTNHINSIETIVDMVGVSTTVYALSNTGKIVKSTNGGANWSNVSRVTIAEPKFLLYTGSSYVVVGYTGEIATSSDAITWTYGQSDLKTTTWGSKTIELAVYLNGAIIIVGSSSGLATSTNGIAWTYRGGLSTAWGGTITARSIAYGGGKYVVGGDSGKIATSTDLVTWTNQTSLSATTYSTNTVFTICYAASKFVVAGTGARVATSPDGITWTYQAGLRSSTWGTATDAGKIIHNGTVFIVRPTSSFDNTPYVATSSDGVTWTAYTSSSQRPLYGCGILYYNAVYYSYGSFGSISYSTSLPTWVWPTDVLEQGWGGATVIGMYRLPDGRAIAFNSKGSMAVTTDGSTWTYAGTIVNESGVNIAALNVRRLAYGADNRLLIFESATSTANGTYYLSNPNSLTTFTRYTLSTSQPGHPIWDGSKFVAVGNSGTVRYSTDGVNWSTGTDLSLNASWGTNTIIHTTLFNGSVYIAVSSQGKIARSTDGINWTYVGQPAVISTTDAIWDGNKFIILGGTRIMFTSVDGQNWSVLNDFIPGWGTVNTNSVAYRAGKHYIFGSSGQMAVSEDNMQSWTMLNILTTGEWSTVNVTNSLALSDRVLISSNSTNALNKLIGAVM